MTIAGARAAGPASGRWVVITAMKRLATAKTRLALADPHRRELACAMAMDTIDAALRCTAVAAVLVVTADEHLARMAARHPARAMGRGCVRVLDDEPDGGLNAAFSHGLGLATSAYPDHAAVAMPADLPCLDDDGLEVALRLSGTQASAVVPDADWTGTVLLTQPAHSGVRPRFGVRSFAAHVAAGARPITDPRLRAMRHDIDTLRDLHRAAPWITGPRTVACLDRLPLDRPLIRARSTPLNALERELA